MKRFLKIVAIVMLSLAVIVTASIFGASWYYTSPRGDGCARCHEMASTVNAMQASPHRNAPCADCHEASLTTKLRHIRVHLVGNWPEEIRLRDVDVLEMVPDCQKCHQNEYVTWHAGPHSATYGQIFTNPVQNSKQHLMDDCLRCHGMHFDGSIRALVQPMNSKGPWHLIPKGIADQPAMPCQTCHWIHRKGALATRPKERISVAGAAVYDSLAFYDRRESMHFAAAALPIPLLYDGARVVKMSQDPRQAICYQCHAPREPDTGTPAAAHAWGPQVGSGDDRTPVGVHEGLSCISCHDGHNMNVRASCKTCHPQMSNCGLDVEKMDTTYAKASSPHNIHWVRCMDCHQHGIPKIRTSAQLKQ
ncbi:MAG: multiheme c-type cytochrome [Terracidiphilus sp.]